MAEWIIAKRKYKDLKKQLLYNRGVDFGSESEAFFKPDFGKDLHDPFLLSGMKKAVSRIKKAKDNNEIIGIFADYDADGIPGGALLYKALTKVGIKSVVYIPNRDFGYGLSKAGIDFLIEKKASLIITVDLGIRNILEANYCLKKDVDLIITDHHLPPEKLPQAKIIINPKIKGNKYPFKELCGCGVVYKLIWALNKIYPKELDEKFLKWNLDLVAISTIADVVPLLGENRMLAKYGMLVLRKTKNIGLKELYKVSGIIPEKIDAYITGFAIAPRINAPGRIDHATKSFELLIAENLLEAKKLAKWLNEKNQSRQIAMEKTEKEAMDLVKKRNEDKNKIIIVCGDWIKGVIGPTASRLVEKFNKPVILFSADKEKMVGSARSVTDINIIEILEKAVNLTVKMGGHKGAAGVTVLGKNFQAFYKKIIKIAAELIDPKFLVKKIKIDAEVIAEDLNKKTALMLMEFEPFGMGNPKPVLKLSDINIVDKKRIGQKQNHLSFTAKKDKNYFKAIYFNCGDHSIDQINNHTKYDIAFNLILDQWKGKEYLKLNIVDIKETL